MLHYFRCRDCLSTLTYDSHALDAHCACGGEFEYLGQVRDNGHAVQTYEIPACDDRCTHARGPMCVCACGGENHGTGLSVVIHRDNGNAVVKPADDKAIARGAEYRQAVQAVEDALKSTFGATYDAYWRHEWIQDKSKWSAIYYGLKDLNAAQAGRTHKGRMTKLSALRTRIESTLID